MADTKSWKSEFDRILHGDFITVGNTVLVCPSSATHCQASESGKITHGSGLNNDYSMRWVDVDQNPATYNSSTARVRVPEGGTVVHALLSWAGNLRSGSTGPCGRSARWPAGTPGGQAVSLSVNGTHSSIGPDRFTLHTNPDTPAHEDRWYSAVAEVTEELAGSSGTITVTVGNIWTGQGYGCFGGWSLTLVWKAPGQAPLKRVVLLTGHARIESAWHGIDISPPGLRTAGGTTRIGVHAYEGDLGLSGDALVVNGVPQRGPGQAGGVNFFLSHAAGALRPRHWNNMSVDARDLTVGAEVIGFGESTVNVDIITAGDFVLLTGLAFSFPQPELTVHISTDSTVVHPGDPVTQTARITNTGGVPLRNVTAVLNEDPDCALGPVRLAPGATEVLRCTRPARDERYRVTVTASATAPGGRVLAAAATTPVRVIHPAVELRVKAPDTAVRGQLLDYELTVTNTGDTTLFDVSLQGSAPCAVDMPDVLGPTETVTRQCTAVAGSYQFTVRARDELGATVRDTAEAKVTLLRAGLSIDITGPVAPSPEDELVTVTVRVHNTGQVPLRDIRVEADPSACDRAIGRLRPGGTAVYTCRVQAGTTVRLSAIGTPVISGQALDARRRTTSTHATLVNAVPPAQPDEEQAHTDTAGPQPPQPPQSPDHPSASETHSVAATAPLDHPATTAAVIAVFGVLIAMVTVGSLSTAIRAGK